MATASQVDKHWVNASAEMMQIGAGILSTPTYQRAREESGELSRSLHFPRTSPPNTRYWMDRVLAKNHREALRAAIHTLLTAELLELRYNDLDCAISELKKQVVRDI